MKLEVFFDYACPYCLRGHESLVSLLPEHPKLEVEWRPCEAHPRPENYGGRHSDLLAMTMLFARDNGAELAPLHERLYKAALADRVDIDDPAAVAKCAGGLVDTAALLAALKAGTYKKELTENNHLAWGTYDFEAVPSLILDGKTLISRGGVGLTANEIRAFLAE
jgi:predicted DsbA family dithiol-disulfide isomerase